MEQEYQAYIDSLNSYRDLKNSLDTAKVEGKAEGEKSKTIEIAKRLKKDNIPIELIAKYTNLTIEEIEKI